MAISRKEIYLAVGTAFLSFLGAVLGVYLSSLFDQSNWERRFELEQRRVILEKRASLIERTVVLFNKSPTILGLRGSLEGNKQLAFLATTDLANSTGKSIDLSGDRLARIEATAKEIHGLNAEFSAVMSMDAIYFGPETQRAVKDIMKDDPWVAPEAKQQALVDAMGKELHWFPSKL